VPAPNTSIAAPKKSKAPVTVKPTRAPAGPIETAFPPAPSILVAAAPPVLCTRTSLPWKSRFSV
jgi:hypothetical protein